MTDFIQSILDTIAGLDPVWAPVAFILLYIAATVLFIPGSLTTLAAGFLFGAVWGSIYVSIASTVGASLAFLIGRYLARNWVGKKIENNPKFTAVDKAIGREGAKIVFLLRLSPVFPFSLMNYALGLTKVPFRKYLLASWIGMLPGTILYVYIGSLFKSVADITGGDRTKTSTEWAFYTIGLVATILVSIYITKISKKAIQQAI